MGKWLNGENRLSGQNRINRKYKQNRQNGLGGLWKLILLALMVTMLFTGCGISGEMDAASSSANMAIANSSANDAEAISVGGAEEKAEAPRMPQTAEIGTVVRDQAGSGEAVQGGGSGEMGLSPGALPMQQPSRMIIYKANLTMEVKDYADAYISVQNLIHLSGGYIVQLSEHTSSNERAGTFTIKVPAGDFNSFLQKVEQIPNVSLNRSLNGQDVSEEYVDLQSRLEAKIVVEQRYLSFMERATKTEDLIKFTNELAAVQEEIERLKGRIQFLEQNVSYSTVELRLFERINPEALPKEGWNLAERMSESLRASLQVMVTVAEGMMVVLAGALPIAIVVGAVGWPIYRFIRRKTHKPQKTDL